VYTFHLLCVVSRIVYVATIAMAEKNILVTNKRNEMKVNGRLIQPTLHENTYLSWMRLLCEKPTLHAGGAINTDGGTGFKSDC